MRFNFSDEQRLLQQTVREFLAGECDVAFVRGLWDSATGHCPEFWAKLAEIGLPGLLIAEAHGGLGLSEIDFVLLLEEAGRAALPGPLVETALVAAPLLAGLAGGDHAGRWLPAVAAGEARVAVGHAVSPFVSDAHVADLLLLQRGNAVHALAPGDVSLVHQASNDPARRIFSVQWEPRAATEVGNGAEGRALWAAALDRGALGCAAQQLGVGQKLVDLAVAYAGERRQFGVPIGSFQAIKHMLANVVVRLEYARSLVYRAAHSVARDVDTRAADVSAAKLASSEAALAAARTALQVHGAIGYTWEQDLHVWMRRAWSLDLAWGDGAWHRARLADAVIDGATPARSFGYSPPGA